MSTHTLDAVSYITRKKKEQEVRRKWWWLRNETLWQKSKPDFAAPDPIKRKVFIEPKHSGRDDLQYLKQWSTRGLVDHGAWCTFTPRTTQSQAFKREKKGHPLEFLTPEMQVQKNHLCRAALSSYSILGWHQEKVHSTFATHSDLLPESSVSVCLKIMLAWI